MTSWTRESINLANNYDYLDRLYTIYRSYKPIKNYKLLRISINNFPVVFLFQPCWLQYYLSLNHIAEPSSPQA